MSRYRPNAPAARNGVTPSCVVLPSGPWRTVLEFLVQRFGKVSPAQWLARLERGEVIAADGRSLAPHTPYQAGRRLYYYREVETEPEVPFTHQILYQDAHLLVVDKPHFLPVIPSGKYVQQTLLVRLKRELGLDALSPIHRIDRDTAGLVLFSVNPATRNAYQALFRERRVQKTYHAVAHWAQDLAWPLLRESRIAGAAHFMQQAEVPGPVNAITHIDLLRVQGEWALYALQPVTGQRHQLRVHMAALGLPLWGDGIYPQLLPENALDYTRPLQLLAKSLAFVDPLSGELRNFESRRELDIVKLRA